MSRSPLRVPWKDLEPGPSELSGDAARYVAKVHRLGPGAVVALFDPSTADEAPATITSIGRGTVSIVVGQVARGQITRGRSITVLQSLAKGDKMDAIVRDATELGATRVAPVIAERSVAQKKSDAAVERWRRIAIEAARQCGRADVPRIDTPRPLHEVVSEGEGLKIVLVPEAEASFGKLVAAHSADQAFTILVGPEGGLEDAEVAAASSAGFVAARLGALVLRTETACAAALGAILGVEGTR